MGQPMGKRKRAGCLLPLSPGTTTLPSVFESITDNPMLVLPLFMSSRLKICLIDPPLSPQIENYFIPLTPETVKVLVPPLGRIQLTFLPLFHWVERHFGFFSLSWNMLSFVLPPLVFKQKFWHYLRTSKALWLFISLSLCLLIYGVCICKIYCP